MRFRTAETRTVPAHRLVILVALLAVTAAMPARLAGQEPAETIVTDRPGTSDGAWVVGAGLWQLEAGTALLLNDATSVVLGQALLRVGLGPLEDRIYPNSYVVGSDGEGLQNLGLGIKVPVVRGATRLSVLAGGTLPTGTGQAGGSGSSAFWAPAAVPASWRRASPSSSATTSRST